MPPLVPCEQCGTDVAAEAEVCPRCGNALPRKAFNAGRPWVECPACHTTNSYHPGRSVEVPCRACGASLEPAYREKDWEIAVWRQVWWLGLIGAGLGVAAGAAMGEAVGWLGGGFVAAIAGIWVGYVRYLLLVHLRIL